MSKQIDIILSVIILIIGLTVGAVNQVNYVQNITELRDNKVYNIDYQEASYHPINISREELSWVDKDYREDITIEDGGETIYLKINPWYPEYPQTDNVSIVEFSFDENGNFQSFTHLNTPLPVFKNKEFISNPYYRGLSYEDGLFWTIQNTEDCTNVWLIGFDTNSITYNSSLSWDLCSLDNYFDVQQNNLRMMNFTDTKLYKMKLDNLSTVINKELILFDDPIFSDKYIQGESTLFNDTSWADNPILNPSENLHFSLSPRSAPTTISSTVANIDRYTLEDQLEQHISSFSFRGNVEFKLIVNQDHLIIFAPREHSNHYSYLTYQQMDGLFMIPITSWPGATIGDYLDYAANWVTYIGLIMTTVFTYPVIKKQIKRQFVS